MFEVLDKQTTLTPNQWRILGAAIIGDALEFFDYFLISFVLAFIIGPWRLTFGQSAVVLLSSGIGAIVGAFGWGWIADRIGRRKVFILTVLNFSLATGTLYFTPDNDWVYLSVARFFVGRRWALLRRPPACSRVHAFSEARLGQRPRHLRHPPWRGYRRRARRLCDSDDRLARPLRGRRAASLACATRARLGTRIAAVVGAPRAQRRSARVSRLGDANQSAVSSVADGRTAAGS